MFFTRDPLVVNIDKTGALVKRPGTCCKYYMIEEVAQIPGVYNTGTTKPVSSHTMTHYMVVQSIKYTLPSVLGTIVYISL